MERSEIISGQSA